MTERASVFRFGQFELDEKHRQLRLRQQVIVLQPLAFRVLSILIRNRNRIVSKDELMEALWPNDIVGENCLYRAIGQARTALGQGDLEDAIRTHSRRGYQFCIASAVAMALPK